MHIRKCTASFLIIFSLMLIFISNATERSRCDVSRMSAVCVNMTGKFLHVIDEEDIRSITIRNSDMKALNKEDFLPFSSATHLTIITCSLEFPDQGNLFALLPDLTTLRIVSSNVTEDVSIAFAENRDIKALSLPGNKIKIVRKNLLSGLSQIENIDLSNNEIERVEEGAFDELTFLKKINLANNRIGAKFDRKYVTLPTYECIICRKYVEKYSCTQDDLEVCDENRHLDQLWWMPLRVTIQLKHNPFCVNIVKSLSYSAHAPIYPYENSSTDTSKCIINKSEKCFKHERRDIFLFESCDFEKQTLESNEFNTLSTILSSETSTSILQQTTIEMETKASMFPTPIYWILIMLALLVAVMGTAWYSKKTKDRNHSNSERNKKTESNSVDSENVPLTTIPTENHQFDTESVRRRQLHTRTANNVNGLPEPSTVYELDNAILSRDIKKVMELLKDGVDTNTPNRNGDYPLHLATRRRDYKIAQALIHHGSDKDKVNSFKETALHISIRAGDHDISEILIEQNANVNIADYNGDTSLHIAASSGNEKIVELLLNHKASTTVQNNSENTPVFVAACNGHERVVELLLPQGIDIANHKKDLPIHIAVWNGHHKVVKLLLDNGSAIEERDWRGNTPLQGAARQGNLMVAKLLLNHEANIHTVNNKLNSVLHRAAKGDNPEMIKLLLEKGANREAMNINGHTPNDISLARENHQFSSILSAGLPNRHN